MQSRREFRAAVLAALIALRPDRTVVFALSTVGEAVLWRGNSKLPLVARILAVISTHWVCGLL